MPDLLHDRLGSVSSRLITSAAVSTTRGETDTGAENGVLVEYKKDQKAGLALVLGRDGKRNWKAVDIRQGSACDVSCK